MKSCPRRAKPPAGVPPALAPCRLIFLDRVEANKILGIHNDMWPSSIIITRGKERISDKAMKTRMRTSTTPWAVPTSSI